MSEWSEAIVNAFRIHAKLPEVWESAHIWAWNEPEGGNLYEEWPGELMQDEGNGYCSAEVPEWVNHIIISSDEGSVETEKIELMPRELWISIKEDLSYNLSYDCPQIMLRALLPDSWKAPLVWGWAESTGRNVFDSWPGKVFHWDGEVQRILLPYWTEKIIISADGCQLKSEAIALPVGENAYLRLCDAAHYEVRTEPFEDWEEEKAETPEPEIKEEELKPEKPADDIPKAAEPERTAEQGGIKNKLIIGAALVSAAAAAIIAVVRLIKHR